MTICPCCERPMDAPFAPLESLVEARMPKAERKIVESLARAYPRAVEKSALIDLLYDDDPQGGPDDPGNVVSTLVCRLRSKLPNYGWTIPRNKTGAGAYGRYRLVLVAS